MEREREREREREGGVIEKKKSVFYVFEKCFKKNYCFQKGENNKKLITSLLGRERFQIPNGPEIK